MSKKGILSQALEKVGVMLITMLIMAIIMGFLFFAAWLWVKRYII